MAIQRQDRRGTTTEHNTFTGAVGEITVDTDLDEIRIHNGSRAGGFNTPNFSSIQKRLYNYGDAGGTVNAITVSTQVDALALISGLRVSVKITSNNTAAATLQWGSLTAKNIKKYVSGAKADLAADDLLAGRIYDFDYDGTDWVVALGGAGGSWETVYTETASASTELGSADLFENGYLYRVHLSGLDVSGATTDIRLQYSTDGSTFAAGTNYFTAGRQIDDAGTETNLGAVSASWMQLTDNTDINQYTSGTLTIYNPRSGANMAELVGDLFTSAGTNAPARVIVSGRYTTATAIRGFRVYPNGGNFVTGFMTVERLAVT